MMLELIYIPFFQKNRLPLKEIKIERKINSGLSYSYNHHSPPPPLPPSYYMFVGGWGWPFLRYQKRKFSEN